MKKLIILILVSNLFLGCSNIFNSTSNVNFTAILHTLDSSENTRVAEVDANTVVTVELWISDQGVNYLFAGLTLEENSTQLFETKEDELVDFKPGVVRHFTSSSDSVTFDVNVNIPKTYTMKATLSSGRVFMGSVDTSVKPYTESIQINLYETASSASIVDFDDLHTYIIANF